MAYVDPARAKKRTKDEIIAMMREACRQEPCVVVKQNRIQCPFCPHHKKDETANG